MEPTDDRELNRLLREWKAPAAPPHLHAPRRPAGQPWWRWLLTGTIRVPVPAGLAAVAALIAIWIYSSARVNSQPAIAEPPAIQEPVVSLADFQPVDKVELRVVGEVR
jgi:hypothetical protein